MQIAIKTSDTYLFAKHELLFKFNMYIFSSYNYVYSILKLLHNIVSLCIHLSTHNT